MKLAIACLAASIVLPVAIASAQTTTFYGPQGQYQGTATRNGNGTTTYYGPQGQYQGNSQKNGMGGTTYYGPQGQYQGTSQSNGLRR